MIQPYEITIGCLLRTRRGEVIRVESISTERQHRKIGYYSRDDCTHIKYVRMGQVEGIPLSVEMLKANGFYREHDWSDISYCRRVYLNPDDFLVQIDLGERYITIQKIYDYDNEDGEYEEEFIFSNDMEFEDTIMIHQFQQFLYLCGLNECANKFEI